MHLGSNREWNYLTNVGRLQLKQVVHSGEATIELIEGFEKLFSLDISALSGRLHQATT